MGIWSSIKKAFNPEPVQDWTPSSPNVKKAQQEFKQGTSSFNQDFQGGGVYKSIGGTSGSASKSSNSGMRGSSPVYQNGGGSTQIQQQQTQIQQQQTQLPMTKIATLTPSASSQTFKNNRQPTPFSNIKTVQGSNLGVKRVKSFIESERAKDHLRVIQQQRRIQSSINQQTIIPSRFEQLIEADLRSKSKTIKAPSEKEIIAQGDNRGTFKTIIGRGQKPKLSSDELAYAVAKERSQVIQQELSKDFKKEYKMKLQQEQRRLNPQTFQERINRGENYNAVNTEYLMKQKEANNRLKSFSNEYSDRWYEGRGKRLINEAEKQVERVSSVSKSKEAQAKVKRYFTKGAIVGGAVGVGQILATESGLLTGATLTAVGTGALVVAGGVYGYGLGKSTYTASKEYQRLQDKGFSKKQALQMSALSGANTMSPMAFSYAGAVTGRLAVLGAYTGAKNLVNTGTLKGMTPQDQVIIRDVANRQGAIEQKVISGKLTTTESSRLASTDKGVELIDSLESGQSIKKISVKLSTKGLSGKELSAVMKYNSMVDTVRYQVVNNEGGVVKGSEVTLQSVGKVSPKTTITTGAVKGQILDNKFIGERLSLSSSGKDTGDITYEKLIATGKSKTINGYRVETSKGISARTLKLGIENNQIVSVDKTPNIITSKSLGIQKLTDLSISGESEGTQALIKTSGKIAEIKLADVMNVKTTKIYSDVFGAGKGGGLDDQVFQIKTPKTSTSFKTGGSGSSSVLSQELNLGKLNQIILPESKGVVDIALKNIAQTKTLNLDVMNKASAKQFNKLTSINKRRQDIMPESLQYKTLTKSKGQGDINKLVNKNIVIGSSIQTQSPIQLSKIKSAEIQATKTKQTQKLTTPELNNLFSSGIQGFDFDFDFNPQPIIPKKIKFGGSNRLKKLYKEDRVFKPKYTASLSSAVFNIKKKVTKKQAEELRKMKYLGIETKPILEITDLKKTKKKKKKKSSKEINLNELFDYW